MELKEFMALMDEQKSVSEDIDELLECVEVMESFGLNTDEAMQKVVAMMDRWCELDDLITEENEKN